jgi:hypothetical protein
MIMMMKIRNGIATIKSLITQFKTGHIGKCIGAFFKMNDWFLGYLTVEVYGVKGEVMMTVRMMIIIMNAEKVSIWKEAIMTYLNVASRIRLETEENQD